MNKKIKLNIFSSILPYNLKIISSNCEIIKNTLISTYNQKICISTKGCYVKLVAKISGQIVYKTIYLNNQKCQKYSVNFAFDSVISQKYVNFFTLFDKNYDFPIESAILNFSEIK